ncbi:hypothetical protein SEA_TAYLORSIPHT_63 [Arthrobacter phage TaylorSipht]|nr:hypothetical protein SEA_TAYLORSIPHT_63 [Arthrobacter phage TaylorSipht]
MTVGYCRECGHWHDSRPCLGVERSAGGGIQRCGCRRGEQRDNEQASKEGQA